ncbi:MAG: hypothetical protein J7K61_05680 [Thermoplasmata archaeon]|nr:hypothetical protein [Thermoplasmata archaeon]
MMEDNRGEAFIPIRILISVTMIAAISAVSFIAYENAMKIADEKHVENICQKILSKLEEMKKEGKVRDLNNPREVIGDRREFSFYLPSSVEYVAFGCSPDDADNIINDGHCIIYKIHGRSKNVIWIEDFGFRKGVIEGDAFKITDSGYIIYGGGKEKFLMELVFNGDGYYAIILEE